MAENGKPATEKYIIEIDDGGAVIRVDGEQVEGLVIAFVKGAHTTLRTRAVGPALVSHLLLMLKILHMERMAQTIQDFPRE